MRLPTVQKYKEAIGLRLTEWQLDVLTALYRCNNSTATAEKLSQEIVSSNPKRFTATGSIGRAGHAIADYCNIVPKPKKKGCYVQFVSHPYRPGIGYTMHKNLRTALEELKLVTKK